MNPLAWIEADMVRHMLVEFPLVMGLGSFIARLAPPRVDAAIARVDAHGLTGWVLASLVVAYWMIPAALDAALASTGVNSVKLVSLFVAGFMLRGSMRRSPLPLEAFFVGNFTWMAATVGLIYQEAEARLCLAYLSDTQKSAGFGMVIVAVAVLAIWVGTRVVRVNAEMRSVAPAPARVASRHLGEVSKD